MEKFTVDRLIFDEQNTVIAVDTLGDRIAAAIDRFVFRIVRRWLLFLECALFIYVAQMFLAPALVALGQRTLARPIYWFDGLFCHQRPDRSFYVFGQKMACCQRCAAIYGSIFLFGVFFVGLRSRLQPASFRTVGLLSVPIAIDGLTQLVGLRESTPALRVVTGALFSLGVGWFVFPHLEVAFAEMRGRFERRFRADSARPAGS